MADPDTLSGTGAWTRARLHLADALWGEGFVLPGGAEELRRVAAPLGLTAASQLLLLGAGGGGPALHLAGDHGVWVRAYEHDPYLEAMTARRLQRAGASLAKRATVALWDPANPDFPRRAADCALTLDVLRDGRTEAVLAAVTRALRPGGRVALLELVAPEPLDPADPAVAAWQRLERLDVLPPDPPAVERVLERLGFAVRATEDASARHMRAAVRGWRRLLRDLRAERPDAARAALLLTEAERWLCRVRLMRAGRIRMMRWVAAERRDAT